MIKKTNIDLSISPKRKNPLTVGVQLSSYDKNFHEFEISFLERELKEGDAVDILTVFESSKRTSESTTEIRDGYALFIFDTTLIDRDEVVTNYVYLKSGDSQAEIGAFKFDVKLSEIDNEARVVAKAYDESYESLIQDFEKEIRAYLPKLETMNQEESIRQDEEEVRRLAEADRATSEEIRETAESERVSNEEERKLNEAERISKDSERDSKIEAVEGLQADLISGAVDSASVQQHVEERYGQLEEEYAPKLTEVTAQLAQTEQRVSETIANAGDGTLPTEVVDMRTVNGNTYTVAGDALRAVSDGKGIKDGGVTPEKTSFLRKSTNLLDVSKDIDGVLMTGLGTLSEDDRYSTIDYFIPVKPSAVMSFVNIYNLVQYNKDYEPIRFNDVSGGNWLLSSSTNYIKVSYETAKKSTAQINMGDEVLPYEVPGYHMSDEINVSGNLGSNYIKKTIDLPLEFHGINKITGTISSTENTSPLDDFKNVKRTGRYLKVISGSELMLDYSGGIITMFEYNNRFEFIRQVEIASNESVVVGNNVSLVKFMFEDIVNYRATPKLTYLIEEGSSRWAYNDHRTNRTQDNLTFIYEVSSNEGRDILELNSTEEQYSDETYFNSGILKLPPNYDPDGDPVKLIIFVQGSSGYNDFTSHSIALGYERGYPTNVFGYLLDEGYAILGVYPWTTKYGELDSGTSYGAPIAMSAYNHGYKWVTENYNISKEGVFVSGVSAGGCNGINLTYNKSVPVLATGLMVPTVTPTVNGFGSYPLQRKAYAEDFGFVGDDSVLNGYGSGSPAMPWNDDVRDYIRDNLEKTIGYNPRWNGIINEDLDVLIERAVAREERDYELNKHQKRICPVPIKMWSAEDDANVAYDESRLFIQSIKNAQGNAELRTMPTGTGGHSSIGGSEDTIVVENITTRLGIEQTNVPLAYVELVSYFRRFET